MSHPADHLRPHLPAFGWGFADRPGPLSPTWPAPTLPAPPADDLAALADEFQTLRRECWAALREAHLGGPIFVGRSGLDRLNGQLEAIRALNATLPHTCRSAEIAAWPTPVLPPTVLIGARNLLPVLDLSLRALIHIEERSRQWFDQQPRLAERAISGSIGQSNKEELSGEQS